MSASLQLESRLAWALRGTPAPGLVSATRAWLHEPGHHLLGPHDPEFPPQLREIPDPPRLLFAMGRIELLRSRSLAIVGSRNATPQGRRNAREYAREFSDLGLCIVSGLALGIDAAAHEGALEGSSSSIAVLGNGADVTYPPENAGLYRRLAESGCVITEYCLGMPPLRGNFPRRNRLISGLSLGVLVVEASEDSGSLLTAHLAAEQNREVFAMPGSIHNTMARGCHKLIKEGAKLVECKADVLVELKLEVNACSAETSSPAPTHPILVALGDDSLSLDQVISRTGLSTAECAAQLSMLQIEGRVESLGAGLYQRVESP